LKRRDSEKTMHPEEIRKHVRKQPFRPFRVFMSDGSKYDVHHPELILVARREVFITTVLGEDDIPERVAWCDPIHVTRIEPLNGNRRRSGKKRRK
jgi:hypothetical protein